jgi:type I restriction-modification system DNA methylase subunit
MSGIDREELRIKQNSEVFTPTELVIEIIYQLEKEDPELFSNPNKTFLEPSCGDGQFLSEVIIRKMGQSNCTLEQALSTTYGVELMEDNVKLCKERLAGPNPTMKILKILDKNIVCADALTYDYSFGEPVGVEWLLGGWRALKQVISGSREYF